MRLLQEELSSRTPAASSLIICLAPGHASCHADGPREPDQLASQPAPMHTSTACSLPRPPQQPGSAVTDALVLPSEESGLQSPGMAAQLAQTQNIAAAQSPEQQERLTRLKDDPELKDMFDDIQANGACGAPTLHSHPSLGRQPHVCTGLRGRAACSQATRRAVHVAAT